MKTAIIDGKEYTLIKDIKEGFDETVFKEKYTEYFQDYDYIVGDYSYGKLRLKGFYEPTHKNVKNINNIKGLDKYIEDQCAYGCSYFVIKKNN